MTFLIICLVVLAASVVLPLAAWALVMLVGFILVKLDE